MLYGSTIYVYKNGLSVGIDLHLLWGSTMLYYTVSPICTAIAVYVILLIGNNNAENIRQLISNGTKKYPRYFACV